MANGITGIGSRSQAERAGRQKSFERAQEKQREQQDRRARDPSNVASNVQPTFHFAQDKKDEAIAQQIALDIFMDNENR